MKLVADDAGHERGMATDHAAGAFGNCVEHRLHGVGRARNNFEDVRSGGLPLQRLPGLVEQPRVLDGNYRLIGEGGDQCYLLFSKKLNALAREHNDAD